MVQIAQQYGITRQRVHMIVRAAGVTIERHRKEERNAAIRADRATMTVTELARKYQLTVPSVRHICLGIAGPRYGPRDARARAGHGGDCD
jgi:Mor family transcriptional regulator